ncbi:hypothetical protein QQS21_008632 [Conoideocrella luteorostrata]|uniref:Uncharacterized protein n=1 Tax=Conoideocrella luteorostrata TaxID=1105319 RepID=A0AAJ0CII1_9HYPO|nr:hypothetical protein QQS21_008632 [Conoideocrella luteorostrata]
MHLDHKIRWPVAATHFRLRQSESGAQYGFEANDSPSMESDLGHFSRVLITTIREFSKTERDKLRIQPPGSKLFSDDILLYAERSFNLDEYSTNSALNNPLSRSYKDLSYWKHRVEEHGDFSNNDGDLTDAMKMLIIIAAVSVNSAQSHGAIEALLCLNAQIPLSRLRHLGWGHSFGVDNVAYVTLYIYMFLNISEAVLTRQDTPKLLLDNSALLRHLSGDALQDYDFCAQNIPHRHFWNSLGVTDSWARQQLEMESSNTGVVVDPFAKDQDNVHQEARQRLHQYLKDCFAILYMYDVFLVESCGTIEADAFWMSWIMGAFNAITW